jgi:hypothetical protein
MVRPLRNTLLLLGLAGAACAGVKARETVCPEYRDLRCLSPVVCTLDRARGCEVCRCEEMKQLPPPGYPPGGPGTPDRVSEPPPAWNPSGAERR